MIRIPDDELRIIGITGEAGGGKSVALSYLEQHYPCKVLMADVIGNEVKEPGERCYDAVLALLGDEILLPDGTMNRTLIAEKIFADKSLVDAMNEIIHPAVHDVIFERIDAFRYDNTIKFVFLEAALLIEAGYVDELDELWYICSDASQRKKRLQTLRGYSEERIEGIAEHQLDKDTFMKYADRVLWNNTTKEELYRQIDAIMGEYQWVK